MIYFIARPQTKREIKSTDDSGLLVRSGYISKSKPDGFSEFHRTSSISFVQKDNDSRDSVSLIQFKAELCI